MLIVDFGGQYTQLIARKVREQNVLSKIVAWHSPTLCEQWENADAVILSGGPKSTLESDSPSVPLEFLKQKKPTLGICYGHQFIARICGGAVRKAESGEYGRQRMSPENSGTIVRAPGQVWMSHFDTVEAPPPGFVVTAKTDTCPIAAMENSTDKTYSVQFHPEVAHTENGSDMLRHFLFEAAGLSGDWTPRNFVDESIDKIRAQVGDRRVLCGVSGGVDSTVAAGILARAIGKQLVCVFVDHGLLRKNEAAEVIEAFRAHIDAEFVPIDASKQFLTALSGVTDPEQKRKIIGAEFIRVFEQHADELSGCDFLAQGTLYPDVVESGSTTAATIKTHHNVGGLPDWMKLELIEPLRDLFKDEVRRVGYALGLPPEMIEREPFPGPGLAVRILGEITEEKLKITRDADHIFREELKVDGLNVGIWQSYAALLDVRSVGVMGDERTYQNAVALRAVVSQDAMTAHAANLPHELLERVATRIVNEVRGVNRVLYEYTSKPPATIEWE
ncbi:MAG: glutamine-hydrolyzing GMP synthase [Fimbriimonadales bacterium]